jgi:hypothetical protein
MGHARDSGRYQNFTGAAAKPVEVFRGRLKHVAKSIAEDDHIAPASIFVNAVLLLAIRPFVTARMSAMLVASQMLGPA